MYVNAYVQAWIIQYIYNIAISMICQHVLLQAISSFVHTIPVVMLYFCLLIKKLPGTVFSWLYHYSRERHVILVSSHGVFYKLKAWFDQSCIFMLNSVYLYCNCSIQILWVWILLSVNEQTPCTMLAMTKRHKHSDSLSCMWACTA